MTNKKTETYLSNSCRYFERYVWREIHAWYAVLRYYGVFIPVAILGIVAVVAYFNPFGPKNAYLAVGQTGSSYGLMGDKFQTIFSSYGVDLELIKTTGLVQGLKNLDDPKSKVNASFVTAGLVSAKEYPNLVSLGSFQYAPIWIFYKGEKIRTDDPFEYFSHRKIGIGLPDTNSNNMFRRALELNQHDMRDSPGLLELPYLEAAEQLKAGKIDAVFIIDSFAAPVVQSLLKEPSVQVMSFNLADAYVKKFPFLHKLVIPKGSINLEKVLPAEDIVLLGSTTNLLVEKDTHPAVQWAFMLAASDVGRYTEDFFAKPGEFPRYMDLNFTLSPVAKRYYTQGRPGVFDYVPLWLGSIIESTWVLILAFIALIYPFYKWLMGIRSYPSKKFMQKSFINLRDLEEDIPRAKTKEELQALLDRLNGLMEDNQLRWLGEAEARFYFVKKNIMHGMHKQLTEKIAALDR